jgi:hypothetical protein
LVSIDARTVFHRHMAFGDSKQSPCMVVLAIGVTSLPMVVGLDTGQVQAIQFVAFVEFWLAIKRRHDSAAGAWLSLQLIKVSVSTAHSSLPSLAPP